MRDNGDGISGNHWLGCTRGRASGNVINLCQVTRLLVSVLDVGIVLIAATHRPHTVGILFLIGTA